MADEPLQAEVERLRNENESYRQRELSELKAQLAAAREASEHYRSEALRNADLAQKIDANAQEQIKRLNSQIETMRRNTATQNLVRSKRAST